MNRSGTSRSCSGRDLSRSTSPSSRQQREHFAKLGELYAQWNERVNLISRKDFEHLYERHILHSLGIAKVVQFKKGTRIVDVGTGGGFPLVPLAILFPQCTFHGIDGIGKKITAVKGVVEGLGITNCTRNRCAAGPQADVRCDRQPCRHHPARVHSHDTKHLVQQGRGHACTT